MAFFAVNISLTAKNAKNRRKEREEKPLLAVQNSTPDSHIIVEYQSAVLQAASNGDQIQLQKLISLGKDVNEKDATSHGQTALHVAAETGDLEIVKILLDAKADVNSKDNDGVTPLMFAAQDNELEIARLLLKAGANPNLQDNDGKTAFQKTDSDEIKSLLRSYAAH